MQIAKKPLLKIEASADGTGEGIRLSARGPAALLAKPIIDQIVQMMNSNPDLKIGVEGHTDNVGTPASNKTLSEARAKSVVSAIVAQGIAADRLSPVGFGQDKPIADNNTEEGRAQNRRVELVKK